MKTITTSALIIAALFTFAGTLAAQKPTMKEVTVKGEIIDTKCYFTGMMGGHGEAHRECAVECINGGLPVGLLEDSTDRVYILVPASGMKGANQALAALAATKVAVKGRVVEKGGSTLLVYSSVEEVK